MEQYIIKGGNPLVGDVTISGAKNAALGILAASIMTDDDVLIDNLPDVRDMMNISAVSAHLIILSAPCWENIRALRYRFQADATLEAVPSTSILKVSARWERMYRLNAAQ